MNTSKTTKGILAATAVAGLLGAGVAVGAAADSDTSVKPAATTTQGQGMRHGQGKGQGMRHGQGKGQGMRHGQGKGQGMPHGQGKGAHDPASGLSALPAGTLTSAEQQTLTYMREEEKLAHDVYVKLAATSKLPAFTRIAASETRHGDAVATLLERHGLADPTTGRAAGSFADSELQQLYDRLVADGSRSATAALRAGALIEEQDIADIQKAMQATSSADLDLVYGRLLEGSKHHLQAFVRQLEQRGVDYEPQVLTAAQLKSIVG